MNAEILLESSREHRRSLLWWGVGITLFIGINLVFYPSIRDSTGLSDYSKDMPEAVRALFVGGELDMTSPSGYLNSQIFALMAPTLMTIFAVSAGAAAIAGDEERGLLDLRLAQPVARVSFVLQQLFWLVAGTFILTIVLAATVTLGSIPFDLTIAFSKVVAATVSTALFALLFGALALAVGGLTPGKARAIAVAAAAATVSWVLDGLSKAVSWLEPFQDVSPYYQAFGQNPLTNGAPWFGWLLLTAATALLVCIAIFGLNRRDVRQ
jgi:ABC-2 type transport system permease protein